jgi:transcriptional regulator with XRE-family HTH domain
MSLQTISDLLGELGSSVPPGKFGPFAASFQMARSTGHRVAHDAVLRGFYEDERVHRILQSLAFRYRLQSHVDEVRQRVALLFYERFLPQMLASQEEPENVYKLVYALAFNVFRSILKEINLSSKRDVSIEDSVADDSDNSAFALTEITLPSLGESIDMTEDRIDRERAQSELARRLATASSVRLSDRAATVMLAPQVQIGVSVTVKAPRRRQKVPSSVYGKELATIKQDLGLTNQEFADRLGVGLPTLASYLYARVHTVPEDVLKTARAIHAATPAADLEIKKRMESNLMPQILDEWASLLGLTDPEDNKRDAVISSHLGVNPITVWRWRTSETKPSVRVLVDYHGVITEISRSTTAKRTKGASR